MILIVINTQNLTYEFGLYLLYSKYRIVFGNILFINLINIEDCNDKLVEIHMLNFFYSTFIQFCNFILNFVSFLNDRHLKHFII